MSNEQEILFSHIEDEWSNVEESIEGAARYAFEDLGADDAKAVIELTLYKGVKKPQSFREFLSVDWLIEDMSERASDNTSEDYAEDYLGDVTDDQRTELDQVIVDWAARHNIKPSWFIIEDVKEVTFQVPDEWKNEL